MHQDATWYGGRPHPGDFVLDGYPASPLLNTHIPPFSVNIIVAKLLDELTWHLERG